MDDGRQNQSRNGLEAKIRAELEFDTRFNPHEADLHIAVSPGQILLGGEVPDIGSKRIAVNTSRLLAADGMEVDDRVNVATERLGDKEIARSVGDHLAADRAFARCLIVLHRDGRTELVQQPINGGLEHVIEIGVEEGVVRLAGSVGSLTHRRLAEVLCWWVPGCRRVDNGLDVRPVEQDSDDTLKDAVRAVLEKDPLLDASRISAATAAGIVELEGHAATVEERRLAIRDAWFVPGVWDVRSNISVGTARS